MAELQGRSTKERLLGQLGTFTQNHESITLILNQVSWLPKEKLCEAQQTPLLPAPGMNSSAWRKSENMAAYGGHVHGCHMRETRQGNDGGSGLSLLNVLWRVTLLTAFQMKPRYYLSMVELWFFSLSISGLLG
jgi:hypothetical protein